MTAGSSYKHGCGALSALRRFAPATWRGVLPAVALLLFACPAAGQQAGQWSWSASVGVSGRNTEVRGEGQASSETDDTSLDLSLGLSGFIVHPAIASFGVDVSGSHSRGNGGESRTSDRLGLGASLDLLGRSRVPTSFFFRRTDASYSTSGSDGPLIFAGRPDVITTWGARARVRRGLLHGLLLGMERKTIDLIDPDSGQDTYERQSLDWSRGGRNSRHSVSLLHRREEFGGADFGTDDYTLNISESAEMMSNWEWRMSGIGIRRELLNSDGPSNEAATYNLRNEFFNSIRDKARVSLALELDRSELFSGATVDGVGVRTSYYWRPRPAWEFAPFVNHLHSSSDDAVDDAPETVDASSAGIITTWRRVGPALDSSVSLSADYGLQKTGDAEETRLGYGLTTILAHGEPRGLRKELELEVAFEEVDFTDPVLELPDLGLERTGLSNQDRYRASLGVEHAWQSHNLKGWGTWQRSEASGSSSAGATTETLRAVTQIANTRWDLQLDVATGDAEQPGQVDQKFRSAGAGVGWRITRILGLSASYRRDEREVNLAPTAEGDQLVAKATLYLGQLRAEVYYQENEQSVDGGPTRLDRVFRWAIKSSFAGWLPVVTGTKRRGVIR